MIENGDGVDVWRDSADADGPAHFLLSGAEWQTQHLCGGRAVPGHFPSRKGFRVVLKDRYH